MDARQFSDEFDVLVSSYSNRAQIGATNEVGLMFDEYEKSVYLTKAQKEVVESLYSGKNVNGDSFEVDEQMRRYLSVLVKEAVLEPKGDTGLTGVSNTSKFFTLPSDLWFITYESVRVSDKIGCDKLRMMDVYPITQDDYHRTKRNPFRGPNKRRALRLDMGEGIVEIVSNYDVEGYYLRYLRKPKPIILVDLGESQLNIDGETKVSEYGEKKDACELHEALQVKILEIAAREAISTRSSKSN